MIACFSRFRPAKRTDCGLNPYAPTLRRPYWYDTNPDLKTRMDGYFAEHCFALEPYPELLRDTRRLYERVRRWKSLWQSVWRVP